MNVMSIRVQNENQQKLFDALRRISEDNEEQGDIKAFPHDMPGHSTFFSSQEHLLPGSGFVSSISAGEDSDPAGFSLDFQDSSDSTLSYDPLNPASCEQRLQVDRNGTRVGENSSGSALLPASFLSDLTRSLSMSTCSSMQCTTGSPANATVFAAAVTAAMIVDRPEGALKRPRSPSPESVDEDYLGDDDTDGNNVDDADDSTTDTSSEDSEDTYDVRADSVEARGSPRTVLPLCRTPVDIPSSIPQNGNYIPPISPRAVSGLPIAPGATPQSRIVMNRGASPAVPDLGLEGGYVPVDVESSPRAILSRKRRAEAMERFRRKKAVRCYGRRVRYQIRKRIATTRPRVNGRFARRADAEVKGTATSTTEK